MNDNGANGPDSDDEQRHREPEAPAGPWRGGEGRVYIRRRGRMTSGQARALETLTGRYCIDVAAFHEAASSLRSVGVEIGFGMGQALVEWCRMCPDWTIFGIEVYQPGIGAALLLAERGAIANLKVLEADAAQMLKASAPQPWIDELRIFFPDPWPKKRHAKRRLLQADFVAAAAERMKPGALLRVATDWQPYAEWINQLLACEARLENLGGDDGYAPRFAARGTTNFEARGQNLGHGVWDFFYQRR